MTALIILCLVSIYYLFFLAENLRNNGSNKIIYFASDVSKVGPVIVQYLQLESDWCQKHAFIEVGGGLAPLARYVGARIRFKQCLAIEWATSLILLGRAKNVLCKPRITYISTLVEKYSFHEPSVLYCYLSEEIMTNLYSKGAFEGSLVFCLTFKIKDVKPAEVLNTMGWQSPLRVYDFRG